MGEFKNEDKGQTGQQDDKAAFGQFDKGQQEQGQFDKDAPEKGEFDKGEFAEEKGDEAL